MFSFSKKIGSKKNVVIDVSCGSVGAIYLEDYRDNTYKILDVYRDIISLSKPLTEKNIFSYTIQSLEKVMQRISEKGNHADSVHVVLSSPWTNVSTHNILSKSEKPVEITKNLINSLVEKELEKDTAVNMVDKNEKKEIERKITNIKLNGYSISNPFGMKSRIIEIPYFVSVSSKKVLNEFEKTIKSRIHFKKIEYHSSSFINYIGVRDIFREIQNFLTISIHGEMTDIVAGSGDYIIGTFSFPIGSRTILREYYESKDKSMHLAVSEMTMLASNAFEESWLGDKKSEYFRELSKEWINEVKEFSNILYEKNFYPERIFITSDLLNDKSLAEMLSLGLNEGGSGKIMNIIPFGDAIKERYNNLGIAIKGDTLLDLFSVSLMRFIK